MGIRGRRARISPKSMIANLTCWRLLQVRCQSDRWACGSGLRRMRDRSFHGRSAWWPRVGVCRRLDRLNRTCRRGRRRPRCVQGAHTPKRTKFVLTRSPIAAPDGRGSRPCPLVDAHSVLRTQFVWRLASPQAEGGSFCSSRLENPERPPMAHKRPTPSTFAPLRKTRATPSRRSMAAPRRRMQVDRAFGGSRILLVSLVSPSDMTQGELDFQLKPCPRTERHALFRPRITAAATPCTDSSWRCAGGLRTARDWNSRSPGQRQFSFTAVLGRRSEHRWSRGLGGLDAPHRPTFDGDAFEPPVL